MCEPMKPPPPVTRTFIPVTQPGHLARKHWWGADGHRFLPPASAIPRGSSSRRDERIVLRNRAEDEMRCLITGGAGFIGSHLADALLAR